MLHFSLEHFIAHPFIRLALSLLFPLGILALSDLIIKKSSSENKVENYLFYFLTIIFSICSYIYIHSAVFSNTPRILIKFIAYLICTLPIVWTSLNYKRIDFQKIKITIKSNPIVFFCVLLFGLISLAPATDADSLGYHLAIPLSILQGNELGNISIWNHQYLIGLGDFINLIGLSIGTDCLGAVLQFVSFSLLLLSFSETSYKHQSIFYKLLISPFLLLFLLSSQKNQLFGEISICLAFIFFTQRMKLFKPIVLIFIAFSIKLSFYISGGIVLAFYFLESRNKGRFFSYSILSYFLFLLPIHYFNFSNFGTPIPPFLNFLVSDSEISHIMTLFQKHLQEYSEGFALPFGLFIPSGLSTITTTIGPSFLIVSSLLFYSRFTKEKALLICMIIVSAFLAQKTPRFFLTHFFLAIWIIYQNKEYLKGRSIRLYSHVLSLQTLAMIICTGYGVSQLFPGALSTDIRHKVLNNNAFMYSQLNWANDVLPKNTIVINTFRTNTALNRKFFTHDFFYYLDFAPKNLSRILYSLPDNDRVQKWHLILDTPLAKTNPLSPFIEEMPIATKSFKIKSRNPFSKQNGEKVYSIYAIDANGFLNTLKNPLNSID